MTLRKLKVCLDARIPDGSAGGVQQFVMGLASGLSRFTDGDEEYLFLSYPGDRAWLEPHLSGPCRPLDAARPSESVSGPRRLLQAVLPRGARRAIGSFVDGLRPIRVPASDGTVERSGAAVVHLTLQAGFTTSVPTIYQPFDLQHVHLPRFFSRYQRRWRARTYPELARAARSVVVMSSWIKDDVVRHLRVPAEKVRVISWAPVTEEYAEPTPEDLERTRRRLLLPEAFAVFPAQTYPHKNHLGLIEAVEMARRRGEAVEVVCPGQQNDFYPVIERRMKSRGARGVRFVGYVSPLEIRCLYRLARFLVFPTLFEGGGMPVFEAFAAGLPVACSNVTCLPSQAGDAALLFDPRDAGAMANALIRLWRDAELRAELARRGSERVRRFSWDRTARTYRALYREVAGAPLGSDDAALLSSPPDT
ncbi:MAG TPA: glycosyltransferase family 1 protein [Anaeromyxobacter sp.]